VDTIPEVSQSERKANMGRTWMMVIVLSIVPIIIGFAIAYYGIYNACCTSKYDGRMEAVLGNFKGKQLTINILLLMAGEISREFLLFKTLIRLIIPEHINIAQNNMSISE
jgi:hypothetical protein